MIIKLEGIQSYAFKQNSSGKEVPNGFGCKILYHYSSASIVQLLFNVPSQMASSLCFPPPKTDQEHSS